MHRTAFKFFDAWLSDPVRRPLVVRGARQVGKTWLTRDLAARHKLHLLELNFERDSRLRQIFRASSPRQALDDLSLLFNVDTQAPNILLFLDEIQAAPEVLAQLRWFAEELPQLPVIAAGSLLEFTLDEHTFSMPVGRISYCHIEPMSFPEYLVAHGQERLRTRLEAWRLGEEWSATLHAEAERWFQRYTMVGGMPAVVAADVDGAAPADCRRLQRDLIATYRDDFSKYAGRLDTRVLDNVLLFAVASLGRKFVYAHVSDGVKQHQAKRGLEALTLARLCHRVHHTAANGVPLAAEVSDRSRKVILLDIGLVHGLLGTPAARSFPRLETLSPQVRGQLTEQIVGQELRTAIADPSRESELFFWHREGGRPGEIDYVIAHDTRIVPIELKAGATGAMKSLHQFMYDKHLELAVRLDSNAPTVQHLDLKTTQGDHVRYRLLSLPHWLTWNLGTLVNERHY